MGDGVTDAEQILINKKQYDAVRRWHTEFPYLQKYHILPWWLRDVSNDVMGFFGLKRPKGKNVPYD